jgi:hypothetical protein
MAIQAATLFRVMSAEIARKADKWQKRYHGHAP